MDQTANAGTVPNTRESSAADREALDRIAAILGARSAWSGGDICTAVADIIERTGRPHPGDPDNAATYRKAAEALGIEHDGPEDDEDPDEG